MKTAILTDTIRHIMCQVHTTTDHPDAHYGRPVWVDAEGTAYLQCGLEHLNPYYQLSDIRTTCDIAAAISRSGKKKGDIARDMGISPSTLTGIINNNNPTAETLVRLAEVLGIEVQDFFI